MKSDIVAEARAKAARDIAEAETRASLVEAMGDIPFAPTIANISEKPSPYCGYASISFSAPAYDPEHKYSARSIATALESAGWKLAPACRASYGDWRSSIHHGLQENLPDESSRAPFKEACPVLPVYVTPQQFTNCDLSAWMTAPDGRHYKVSIDIPGKASVSAQKVTTGQFGRDWYYARGTAKVQFPESWHELQKDGETFATILERAAWVDTEQGISGRICWQLDAHEPEAFPFTLAEVMAAMGIA